jgi:hypothetical protein
MLTPTPCPAGSFCSVTGLSVANGNCSAGFYCVGGSGNQFGGTQLDFCIHLGRFLLFFNVS